MGLLGPNTPIGAWDVGTDVGKVFSRCAVDQLSDLVRAIHEGECDLALTMAAAGTSPRFGHGTESRVYAVFVDKPHARSLAGGQRAVLNELLHPARGDAEQFGGFLGSQHRETLRQNEQFYLFHCN